MEKLNDVILNLEKIKLELENLQKEKSRLEKEGIQIVSETQISCPQCGEQNALKECYFFYSNSRFMVVCPKCERNFPIPVPLLKQIVEKMNTINHLRFDELFKRRLIKC